MNPLREGELLTQLARHIPGVIFQLVQGLDGIARMPYASEAITEILELTPDQVRVDARPVFACIRAEDQDRVRATFRAAAAANTLWDAAYRVQLPSRGERWHHAVARPERLPDGTTLWHGFIADITDQRREADELARLRTALDTSLTGFALGSLDGRLEYLNRAALELWGYADPNQVLGQPIKQFWEQDEPEKSRGFLETVRHIGTAEETFTARRADGARRRVQVRANLVPGADGEPRGIIASLVDITEVEAQQQALRIRDEALMTARNALVIADVQGTLIFANPAFVRMWGYASMDEVEGRHALNFADPVMTARVLETLAAEGSWEGELVANRRDGSPFDIRVSANVVKDAAGQVKYLMASVSDITESKRMEAQLRQSQKMQTVGRLAGGVAHDFNNLLTVMKGYLSIVRGQLAPGSPLDVDLAEVDRAATSAAMLTQRLLAFSRRQPVTPQVLDLNATVGAMRAMLDRVIGEDIELRVVAPPDLDRVRFDPNQMEQVLMNLAVNARDAMPGGGRLEIETANVRIGQTPPASFAAAAPGDYVRLSVRDSGCGMSAEVKAQLFEPFFTTKAAGHGTGLGLAMVYGAVSQNDGLIAVESAPDAGAAFHILLPAVGESPSARSTPHDHDLPAGSESVVVVEDEPAIRTLAARVLERQGYRVRAFATGPEAIAVLANAAEQVDLVVTDVIMPEMHGRALADALRAQRPGLRVLFVSGYTEEVIGHHGVMDGGVDFLAKPYSVMTLARRVREALDRPAER